MSSGLQQVSVGAPTSPTERGAGGELVLLRAGSPPGSPPVPPCCILRACSIAASCCRLGLRVLAWTETWGEALCAWGSLGWNEAYRNVALIAGVG